MLSVTDSGCGMHPEVVERAFDPFFSTKAEGQGSGMGLFMTYNFAQRAGGAVRIRSEVGVGTTIQLLLPRHNACAEFGF